MYDWIKALHVVFVLLFAGGLVALLVASMALGKRDPAAEDQSSKLRATVRKWDMWVSQPALGGVWVFGIWAAFSGGWFTQPWLQVKLVLVFLLSGLHGNLAGRLRRLDLASTAARSVVPSPFVTATVVISLAVIAVLAVVKPF
ncbi:MAG: CopD family protein [Hoeflea sp.]|uniref:CopD family protein n=1 Tax=Hoeflea sp. TaxID=1940281 RepID=UPI003EF0A862